MHKEINLDIGGGKSAEHFVSKAGIDLRRENKGVFIVLDPKRFKCPYIDMYPNLQLMRWAASADGSWELPFANQSVDSANMNFIYGVLNVPFSCDDDAYYSIGSSLKRVLKSSGIITVREPKGLVGHIARKFRELGFEVSGPVFAEYDETETSGYLRGLSKSEGENEKSIYFPMQFEARLIAES